MKRLVRKTVIRLAAGALFAHIHAHPVLAQPVGFSAPPAYADLADLADSAPFAVKANVRKLARIAPERLRSPVAPGKARFYVTARTVAVMAGPRPLAPEITYLADVPVDARGRALIAKKSIVLIFARDAPGGQLQLVAPDAQISWTPAAEAQVRAILQELVAPESPPRITGVREAIHVPGTLRGEGETQVFLMAEGDRAASLSIRRRPGTMPAWGVSFSELTAETGAPPARDTLAWYRLACFLPANLPAGTNRSSSAAERAQALADYRFVLDQLGDCPRARR